MGRRIREHSAGGVVVRRGTTGWEVLLIQPRGRSRWQLPKGAIDPGETSETAAIREVREEGGVEASIIQPLEPVTFFYQMHGHRFVKTVDFYLMEFQGGDPADHDHEVDDARWFPVDEAIATLAFDSEKSVLTAGRDHLNRVGREPAPARQVGA